MPYFPILNITIVVVCVVVVVDVVVGGGGAVVVVIVVVVVVVVVVVDVIVVVLVVVGGVEGEVGAPLQDEILGVLGPLIVLHSGAKVSRNWQTVSPTSSSEKMKVLAPKTLPSSLSSCWQAKESMTSLCSKTTDPE